MTQAIPRHLFAIYLEGRRAWCGYWTQAICPYQDERRRYWREGFEDARLGMTDRYKTIGE